MVRSLLVMVLACAGMGQAYAGTGYPIALPLAARSVLAAHPELAGDAIELPARVEAQVAEPVLAAGSLERWPASPLIAKVRLHCQDQSMCLPFYALVHLSATEAASGAQSRTDAAAGHTPGNNVGRIDAPVLRVGQRAFMVIDSGFLHLRMPVTCLQGGTVGSVIRVAGPGRSRVFEAAVLDGATVRGSL